MKFLPLRELNVVTSALNFDTPDCHVTGSCDLYTTKAAGSDKKLYKNIDRSLESQQASIFHLPASLSPPQQTQHVASMNLSKSSPFGPLNVMSSRRTYAYLIATLNASHSDYDFSHSLRPSDFRREEDLKSAISMIDSTLTNVRAPALNGSIPRSYGTYSSVFAPSSLDETSPTWGPNMWAKIDNEMDLNNCQIYSYQPADDPFEEDEPAVWSFHYFFFNKARKRVVYLYARGVPVLSHSSNLRPRIRRGSSGIVGPGASIAGFRRSETDEFGGSAKRASYWLGDRVSETVVDDDENGDGLEWNRDEDGEVEKPYEYESDDYEDGAGEEYDDDERDSQPDEEPIRAFSEDVAGRMELD